MPKYLYRCETCEEQFEIRHSMNETLEKKEDCKKECKLSRIPNFPVRIDTKKGKKEKTGEIVKQFIKDAKREVEEEKEKIRSEDYKP